MKQKNLLLGLVFFILSARAQMFTGRIVDEQLQPMPFANVVLLSTIDSTFITGVVSKDNGTFSIKSDRTNGLLRVTSVGYKVKYLDVQKEAVGDIQLQPDNQTLGEVIVKGYRLTIRQEHEKIIFDLRRMPKIDALKAMDVMKFAPGVVVISNGLYVASKSAAVFVNDRQLSKEELITYLSNLKATDIDHIEVMRNHGGVNDASIEGGVINIVTKKKDVGFNGSISCWKSHVILTLLAK